jgi:hypothetical protein
LEIQKQDAPTRIGTSCKGRPQTLHVRVLRAMTLMQTTEMVETWDNKQK